jgi:hypothetical protein
MKKVILLFLVFIPLQLFASHYMGGEITWQCLINGRFRFVMKLYRECNGITYSNTETISVTNGPISSITLTLLPGANPKDGLDGSVDGRTELSPDCWNFNQEIHCMPTPPNANTGAIEEWYYSSDSQYPFGVLFNGIPPAQGWIFSFSSCCRNPCTNILNASNMSWYLKAIMYSYNGHNAYPCYDNSPRFAEPPETVICTGFPSAMTNYITDAESDSLAFGWAPACDSSNYAPGFSYDDPLPGGVLDTTNGDISLMPGMNGAFVYVIKITEFRCGIKIGEVFREFQLILLACPGVNYAPTMSAPFYDSISGTYSYWTDTINIGDMADANINVIDMDLLPNGNPNTVTLYAYGEYFGTAFTNPSAGCIYPPCATLNPPPLLTAMVAVATHFHWVPDCNQVKHWIATHCDLHYVPPYYYFPVDFVFKTYDNYCPAPFVTSNRLTIVVRAGPLVGPPLLNCTLTDSSGNVTLTWTPPPDTANYFESYVIYRSNNLSGPYDSIATIYNINQNSYTDVGINPGWNSYYYYIRSISGCVGEANSTIVSTTALLLNLQHGNPSVLNWTTVDSILPVGAWYYIYMKCGSQAWVLLDSVQSANYSLTSADTLYDNCQFRVLMFDSAGCQGYSPIIAYDLSGLDEIKPIDKKCFEIYPNPATTEVSIRTDEMSRALQMELYDMYGREYRTELKDADAKATYTMNVSALSPGIYYLRKAGCPEVEKVLIIR